MSLDFVFAATFYHQYILVIFIDTKLQQVEKQISKKKLLMSIEKLVLYRIHSSQAAVGWFLPE